MARRVIGLDVGTYSVKVIHLEARSRAEFDILAYVELPLADVVQEGLEKTEQDLQIDALIELKKRGLVDGPWIATGLPGADGQIRSLDVPFDNPKKIEAVLGGLLDAHLPFSVENLIYSWFPITKKFVADDENRSERTLASHVLVGFAKRDSVAQTLALFRRAELDPRFVTLKAAALYDLLPYLVPKESEVNALYAIVDIGHKSTGICVGDKKHMQFARSVPRGGFHVTQNFAQRTGVSLQDAEREKLAADVFVESLREAYYPIARELRQTILAMETEAQRKVERIFLVGGASKAKGLDEFLSSLLSRPVSLVAQFPSTQKSIQAGPEAGLAVSYAALSDHISKKAPRFNFRREEFTYAGELNYMRQRSKALLAWSALIVLLFCFWGGLRNNVLSMQLADMKARQQQICSTILGQKVESVSKCLSMMQETIVGQGDLGIPEWSAADVYLELAKMIPADVKIKITELDVSDLKVRFSADTSSFEAVEQVVTGLTQSHCFTKIEKSRTRQTQTGAIQFQINLEVNCGKVNEAPALSLLRSPKEN